MEMNSKGRISSYWFTALLIIISFSELTAQEQNQVNPEDFLVVVQSVDNDKIKMKCKEGCAWKSLTYPLSRDSKAQAIDEYGMTNLENVYSEKDSGLSDFLFTVQRSEDGVQLKGLEGTKGTELIFPLLSNKAQKINKSGMTR